MGPRQALLLLLLLLSPQLLIFVAASRPYIDLGTPWRSAWRSAWPCSAAAVAVPHCRWHGSSWFLCANPTTNTLLVMVETCSLRNTSTLCTSGMEDEETCDMPRSGSQHASGAATKLYAVHIDEKPIPLAIKALNITGKSCYVCLGRVFNKKKTPFIHQNLFGYAERCRLRQIPEGIWQQRPPSKRGGGGKAPGKCYMIFELLYKKSVKDLMCKCL